MEAPMMAVCNWKWGDLVKREPKSSSPAERAMMQQQQRRRNVEREKSGKRIDNVTNKQSGDASKHRRVSTSSASSSAEHPPASTLHPLRESHQVHLTKKIPVFPARPIPLEQQPGESPECLLFRVFPPSDFRLSPSELQGHSRLPQKIA